MVLRSALQHLLADLANVKKRKDERAPPLRRFAKLVKGTVIAVSLLGALLMARSGGADARAAAAM